MSVHFVVDSASDILPEEAKKLGITLLPLKLIFGTEEYADGVNITHQEFYEKLVVSKELPTTCQFPPAAYMECFEHLTETGDDIVVITLSSKLSGTYQSAMIAAADYPGKVFVVDSLNATLGQRLLVLRGLELAEQGLSAAEIATTLDEEKHQIRLVAILDTLEYLKKGGRISSATALAGTVLSIKPAVEVRDGLVVMAGKARGTRQGNKLLKELIAQYGGINFNKPYVVAYSGLDDTLLQKFIADCPELEQRKASLPVATVGCVIGTHIGPGAYLHPSGLQFQGRIRKRNSRRFPD